VLIITTCLAISLPGFLCISLYSSPHCPIRSILGFLNAEIFAIGLGIVFHRIHTSFRGEDKRRGHPNYL
jgi:hypothetical protein